MKGSKRRETTTLYQQTNKGSTNTNSTPQVFAVGESGTYRRLSLTRSRCRTAGWVAGLKELGMVYMKGSEQLGMTTVYQETNKDTTQTSTRTQVVVETLLKPIGVCHWQHQDTGLSTERLDAI